MVYCASKGFLDRLLLLVLLVLLVYVQGSVCVCEESYYSTVEGFCTPEPFTLLPVLVQTLLLV